MKIRTALAGLALSALAAVGFAPAATAAPNSGITPMIIDGSFATSAPWAARLFIDGQQFCTATIISPIYILSAEHCVSGLSPSQVTFRIGSLDQFSGGETATAVAYATNTEADLAVLQIDHPVATAYAQLGVAGDVRVGQVVQVYGWGATCTDQPEITCQSQYLKVADVKVTSVKCGDYKDGIAICAKRVDGIPAGGDSGGPMMTSTG